MAFILSHPFYFRQSGCNAPSVSNFGNNRHSMPALTHISLDEAIELLDIYMRNKNIDYSIKESRLIYNYNKKLVWHFSINEILTDNLTKVITVEIDSNTKQIYELK
ncbi:MAG: hypothetical protein GX660_02930 [Clostridiaceae bacterium]|nr:hypothetical protein [Clostridiaceae bacterium]